MTSKPSPWPPQPHRSIKDETPKPQATPEDDEMARRIAVVDEALRDVRRGG